MTDTIVVSSSPTHRTAPAVAKERRLLRSVRAKVVDAVDHGLVAFGDAKKAQALIKAGLRVARYPDTDVLELAGRSFSVNDPAAGLDGDELVPAALADKWPLHVVQFIAPPFPQWQEAVEQHGGEVIGGAGRYGLFVSGSKEKLAALSALPFVGMVHPLLPAWKLDPRLKDATDSGDVSMVVFPRDAEDEVLNVIASLGGKHIRTEPGRLPDEIRIVANLDLSQASKLAALPSTTWIEWQPPATLGGERETQIVAESLTGNAPNTTPVPGYAAALANIGANGAGVTVAIADSGVDQGANNNTTGHLDLRGRQTAFVDYNGVPTDQNGHGTHVAGIAVGNAASGTTEPGTAAFLWGQGVAPGASYVTQSIASPSNPAGPGVLLPAIATLCQDSVNNGATIQNDSWSSPASTVYSTRDAAYDVASRDSDSTTTAFESLTVVFAARNSGGLPNTIGEPAGAKNVLTVGNGLTRRPGTGFPDDDIRGINGSSSRGPAPGGRIKPDIVAPGTDVPAALSAADATPNAIAGTNHTYKSGTSMAAPHAAGACAVLTDWWRQRTGGKTPSPAMLKALLINGAEDLAGGSNWRALSLTLIDPANGVYQATGVPFAPTAVSIAQILLTQVPNVGGLGNGQWHFDAPTNVLTAQISLVGNPSPVGFHCLDAPLANIPNNDQGWGRISLDNIAFQSPDSDRGPRLFLDQRHAFTANGQSHTWRVRAVNESQPMRATIVWTDAPGAAGSSTPLVNDLDLVVTQTSSSSTTTWRGNNFNNGFSVPGGTPDSANNVECVYIQSATGVYTVAVNAQTLVADARLPTGGSPWQDYALVLENAEFASADPVAVGLTIDRSGSMVSAGYVDVTRAASKQFVDLLNFDDRLGVISFGDNGIRETGTATSTVLLQNNMDKNAARTAIDDITFSGCTYMGQGLEYARDQLATFSGPRAIVLLSDGKDNKGCAQSDPTRPWAEDVAAGLPSDMAVYTCAMGPASDQETLEDIASVSDGKYYYMPTIDDLHEIYNFIRGNVTSDGVVVNTTSTASSSRVAAPVDCRAERAVFACHWHADGLRWVGGKPSDDSEIQVVLRTPSGQVVPADASWINRIEGDGYVAFTIEDPAPGRWYVEVRTARREHTRYTVGGWVRSEVALQWGLADSTGRPYRDAWLRMTGLDGLKLRYSATMARPTASIPDLLKTYRDKIARIQPDDGFVRNGIDPDLARLVTWDFAQIKKGKPSLFTPAIGRVPVEAVRGAALPRADIDLRRVMTLPGRGVVGSPLHRFDPTRVTTPAIAWPPAVGPSVRPTPTSGSHRIRVKPSIPGSYTLRVHVRAIDPRTDCTFERVVAQSFVARDQ